ncbi:MAG: GNAT family N-acetyltransferase [Chloroflexota bacterium]
MLNVRRASLADAEAIARIHVGSWQEAYRGVIPDSVLDRLSVDARLTQWRTSLADPNDEYHRVFVGEVDGDILGFVSYGAERESDPVYRGELFAIYIMRSGHRRGLGRRLVAAVAQSLLDIGLSSMLVWVLGKNPARGFYERLGGVYLREKPIEIGGTSLREVAYGWKELKKLLPDE